VNINSDAPFGAGLTRPNNTNLTAAAHDGTGSAHAETLSNTGAIGAHFVLQFRWSLPYRAVAQAVDSQKEFAMRNKLRSAALLAAYAATTSVLFADAPAYSVIPLEGLVPGATTWASGMNNQGQLVGLSYGPGGDHAVVWIDGVIQDLGLGEALDINEQGTIVGKADVDNRYIFLWDAMSGRRTLATPAYARANARGISASGRVAGTVENFNPLAQWGFICEEGGAFELLVPVGSVSSNAKCINSQGHVAGTWKDAAGIKRAFVYRDGVMISLSPPLAGYVVDDVGGINDADVITVSTRWEGEPPFNVCYKYDVSTDYWSELVIPFSYGTVGTINNYGQVVGSVGEPALWDADGTVHRLYDLIPPSDRLLWALNYASAINDSGAICGAGYYEATVFRAYLAVPGTCSGDVVADGHVDLGDLAALLSAFGSCSGDATFRPAADLDSDACVDLDDLGTLIALFGTSCW
jgi:probable HAF family extracellular repeat protein